MVLNLLTRVIENAPNRVNPNGTLGISKGTLKSYRSFHQILFNYEEYLGKQILFIDLDKIFVENFIRWLRNEMNYSVNYIGRVMSRLKTLSKEAKTTGLPVNSYTESIRGFSQSDEDRRVPTLTKEEIQRIKYADNLSPYLNNARKWMLIQLSIGCRVGDLLSLTKYDIRELEGHTVVDILQEKTGTPTTIPILDPDVAKFATTDFPYKISPQKYNNYLKEVCDWSGVNELTEGDLLDRSSGRKVRGNHPKYLLLSSHSLRRSFATIHYGKIPTALIMKMTGHKREATLRKYINTHETNDADALAFINALKNQ